MNGSVAVANDLRKQPGQVDQVGGIRYLPHERVSIYGCSPNGVVPRELMFSSLVGAERVLAVLSFSRPSCLTRVVCGTAVPPPWKEVDAWSCAATE